MSLSAGMIPNLADDSSSSLSSSPQSSVSIMASQSQSQLVSQTQYPLHSIGNANAPPTSAPALAHSHAHTLPAVLGVGSEAALASGMTFAVNGGSMLPLPLHSSTIRGPNKSTVSSLTSAPDYPIPSSAALSSYPPSAGTAVPVPLSSSSPSSSTIAGIPGAPAAASPAASGSGKKKGEKRKSVGDSNLIRRLKHKEVEIRRRAKLAKLFSELQEVLSTGPMDKASILQAAILFVRQTKGLPTAMPSMVPSGGNGGRVAPPYAAIPTSMDAMQTHSTADGLALQYPLTSSIPLNTTSAATLPSGSLSHSAAAPMTSGNNSTDDESMAVTDDGEEDDEALPALDNESGLAEVGGEGGDDDEDGDDDDEAGEHNGAGGKRKKRALGKDKRGHRGKSGDKAKEDNPQGLKVEGKESRARQNRATPTVAAGPAVTGTEALPK